MPTWPFKRRATPGWLVVSLADGMARFAHVKPGPRPAVHFLEERQWDAKEPKDLERSAKALGAGSFQCTTVLAQPEYQILLVEAPNLKRDELRSAMRWRIKDMIDYHVDEATLDVLDVPSPRSGATRPPSMYVVVTRSATIQGVISRFDQARIPLAVIDVPDTAQRNIAALYEPADRGVLTLSFDVDGGLITVSAGGELYLSRRLDIGYVQVNAEGGEHEHAFDRVLVEVQRSLDHFERNFAQVAVAKVLVAPMAQGAALASHLAANLYLPVEPMELADKMDLPQAYTLASPEKRAAWFRLIGAGLRVEERVL
jgi:MSHA biogenesis protein MshI